uniref:GTP-binding protein YPT1 n=1 Tax=Schizaphis graminum TaxID=13262 RepID=A0A2S2PP05_SCHGA
MISKIYDFQHQSSNIKKELDNINVTNKPKLDSDIKLSTIPEQGPMIKKKLVELPEVPNKQSQLNITDTTIYKLGRSNSGISDNKYKLIIVGNSNAGKSSIITRYCNDIYQPLMPTIGIDYYNSCVEFKGKIIQIKIWDTAGTEKYRSLSTSYYRGSNGVFIVYDITDLNSLFKLNDWITDIQEASNCVVIKLN